MQQVNLYNPYRTELYHAGIKGMRWGIRRFQNEDGSLTPAGRERYGVGQAEGGSSDTPATPAKPAYQRIIPKREKKSKFRDLSDEELKARLDRIRLEQQYIQAKNDVDEKSMGFVKKTLRDVGQKAVSSLANYVVGTAINKLLGADVMQGVPKKHEKEDKELNDLKRKAEVAKLKEDISRNTASLEDRTKNRAKAAKEEAEAAKKEAEEKKQAKEKAKLDTKAEQEAKYKKAQEDLAKRDAEDTKRRAEKEAERDRKKAERKAEQKRREAERAAEYERLKEVRIRLAEQKARDRVMAGNSPAYRAHQAYLAQYVQEQRLKEELKRKAEQEAKAANANANKSRKKRRRR